MTIRSAACEKRPSRRFRLEPHGQHRHEAEPRQQAADICRRANILVPEDNPYGLLRFDGKPLTPLRAANPDDVVYMGSFSKIFAPGLRIGWALENATDWQTRAPKL